MLFGLTLAALVSLCSLGLALTDRSPRIQTPTAPDAAQVNAARTAVSQLLSNDDKPALSVRFDATELAALASLASDGLRPARFRIKIDKKAVRLSGSYELPFGRWLNFAVTSRGKSTGFPAVNLAIGKLDLSEGTSRQTLELARHLMNMGSARIPPLDSLIKQFEISEGAVSADISRPALTSLLAQLGAGDTRSRGSEVLRIYCSLAKQQIASPSTDFATHTRRAFLADVGPQASADANRAALIALAMLVVDPTVGEIAGLSAAQVKPCRIEPVEALLHGRADLSKHWSLSAAIAVRTGTQFSQSIGEWKELGDSISRLSQLEPGDPSGFSFVDLAADRSGMLAAQAATADGTAATTKTRLAKIDQEGLLPSPLLGLEDGMSNAAFVKRYGSIDDPRFLAITARIDAELHRSTVR